MKTRINLNANPSTVSALALSHLRGKIKLVLMPALLLLSVLAVQAQETSRQIAFTNLATTLPPETTQSLTVQLLDAGGAVLFAEAQPKVAVDANGQISFLFGALTKGGLDPAHFPSGSSRFIDVVLASSASEADRHWTGFSGGARDMQDLTVTTALASSQEAY